MKNKLFLTSMVAVMLACPAYATLVNDPDAQHQSGTIEQSSSSESCDADPLTYQGATGNYGTYTLTAQWDPNNYNVTYAVGTCDGSDKTYSNALTYGQNYTVLGIGASDMTVTEPTGYTFNGWTESLSGNATRQPGYEYQPWNTDGGLTLTAQCSANNYQVKYVCDNGSVTGTLTPPTGETSPDPVTYGDPYTFWNLDVCDAQGQTNQAWECVGDVTGNTIDQNANATSWATAENVTCTAQYAADMVDLIWKYENGNSDTQNNCNYGNGNISIPANPSKPGYTFTGWKVTGWTGSDVE
ncbi:MAG: InlB B-repeat-containing protein [Alphaproteobacteria bacterium]|nr:InlB B-repeat-containing protein [Alphaproteobacteria bacterium]